MRNHFILLVTMSAAALLCHAVWVSWPLRARLNLLLRGYLVCDLRPPDTSQPSEVFSSHVMISSVVYKSGKWIGNFTPFGVFMPAPDAHGVDPLNANITSAMLPFCFQWITLFIGFGTLLHLLWELCYLIKSSPRKDNMGSAGAGMKITCRGQARKAEFGIDIGAMLQPANVLYPDNTSMTTLYTPDGNVQQTSGSRVYPAGGIGRQHRLTGGGQLRRPHGRGLLSVRKHLPIGASESVFHALGARGQTMLLHVLIPIRRDCAVPVSPIRAGVLTIYTFCGRNEPEPVSSLLTLFEVGGAVPQCPANCAWSIPGRFTTSSIVEIAGGTPTDAVETAALPKSRS